jgi:hypothetical protein
MRLKLQPSRHQSRRFAIVSLLGSLTGSVISWHLGSSGPAIVGLMFVAGWTIVVLLLYRDDQP